MKGRIFAGLLLGSGLLAAACLHLQGLGSGQDRDPEWEEKMSLLGQVFSELLPMTVRPAAVLSDEDWDKVRSNARRVARLAHELDLEARTDSRSGDPALHYIAGLLERETGWALEAFRSGRRQETLRLLRGMAGHCVACHTRSPEGKSLLGGLEPALRDLDSLEKARLLAATRRFDRALDEYERAIADPALREARDLEWRNAVRSALSIAVRVQRNPQRALRIIQPIQSHPTLPLYYKEYARAWEKSLREWIQESPGSGDPFAEARRLIDASASLRRYPADHTGDVYLLRALSLLHDLLGEGPRGERASRLLLSAGEGYELLSDPQTWPIHETYYEACIRNLPRSELAGECFLRLERAIDFGYTGSGGTSIPEGVRENLSELRGLAFPTP